MIKCPKCSSLSYTIDGTGQILECDSCGYAGSFQKETPVIMRECLAYLVWKISYRIRELHGRFTYWLAWQIAGGRIWDRAVNWSTAHIYLYSRLPKENPMVLPEGITVADEPIVLKSGAIFDGGGPNHFLTEAVNCPLASVILILGGGKDVTVKNTTIVGHLCVEVVSVKEGR